MTTPLRHRVHKCVCRDCRTDEALAVAEEANSRAAEAFAAGRLEHGELYLTFAERLKQMARTSL
jgi:hypothetical protein